MILLVRCPKLNLSTLQIESSVFHQQFSSCRNHYFILFIMPPLNRKEIYLFTYALSCCPQWVHTESFPSHLLAALSKHSGGTCCFEEQSFFQKTSQNLKELSPKFLTHLCSHWPLTGSRVVHLLISESLFWRSCGINLTSFLFTLS